MNDLSTLKAHLDAAWDEIQDSALSRELVRKEQRAWDANKPVSRPYLRLEKLHAAIAETAALLADDDITELTATIANEKDVKMAEYKLPAEPDGPLWDKNGDKWVRVKENLWCGGIHGVYWVWGDVVHYYGPLTTTPTQPPIKEGDTGLTAEQVWNFPKGSVIWPENVERPEPWMRWADTWISISEFAGDAGELQCYCGDSFRVLILGGDK